MSTKISKARRPVALASGVLAAALLLAACGGGYGATTSSSPGNPANKTQAAPATGSQTVHTGKTSAGTVLVNSGGMTLYAFAADSPGKSTCTAACAAYWPPVAASGSLSHSSDVSAKLGTIKRSDGSTQLTVNGWPMYTYAADSGPGQASGQGENLSGGRWWVVAASGAQIKSGGGDADDSASGSSDDGEHGY
jgi:predicted lipoprotein with Yx(FWY)xxD motif